MTQLAFSSAGSRIFLSAGAPATLDISGFAALSYTEILAVSDIGMVGPETAPINFNPVGDNNTYVAKGVRNNGTVALKGARKDDDPGQILVVAAEKSYNNYSMKIVLANTAIIYAQVLVQSYKTSIGTSGQITGFESNLTINGGIY